jgi:hypothetical protein
MLEIHLLSAMRVCKHEVRMSSTGAISGPHLDMRCALPLSREGSVHYMNADEAYFNKSNRIQHEMKAG